MALTTTLSFSVQNDNKKITITDTTTNYGVSGNITVADITALTLSISVSTSDNVVTNYSNINLYTMGNGPFALQSELVFDITPNLLLVNGVSQFTVDSEFPDGIYTFVYSINSDTYIKNYSVLLDGRVTNAGFELLRLMPQSYLCGKYDDKSVLDVLFTMGIIDSMEVSAFSGNNEAILNLLSVIERLVTNGSNYTW